MNNIILIGMPGSGKSTLGVLLAKAIGYSFVDSDLIIQKQQGKMLQDIINEKGIDGFLQCEDEALCSISEEKTVIATGGSAVLCDKGMKHLKEQGTVIYIKISPDIIEGRIKNIKTRGIVMSKGESIFDIYSMRSPYYEEYAHIILEVGNQAIENTLENLLEEIKGII